MASVLPHADATPASHPAVGSFEVTFLAESQMLAGRRRRRTAPDRVFLVHDSERDGPALFMDTCFQFATFV